MEELTLVTYNIHTGVGTDGIYDLHRIAEHVAVARPDVVCLQEVEHNLAAQVTRPWSVVHATNQAEVIGEAAGLPYLAFGGAWHIREARYGVAICSRHPIVATRECRYSTYNAGEPRMALAACLQLPNGRFVWAVNTHMSHLSEFNWGWCQYYQAQELMQFVEDELRDALIDLPSAVAPHAAISAVTDDEDQDDQDGDQAAGPSESSSQSQSHRKGKNNNQISTLDPTGTPQRARVRHVVLCGDFNSWAWARWQGVAPLLRPNRISGGPYTDVYALLRRDDPYGRVREHEHCCCGGLGCCVGVLTMLFGFSCCCCCGGSYRYGSTNPADRPCMRIDFVLLPPDSGLVPVAVHVLGLRTNQPIPPAPGLLPDHEEDDPPHANRNVFPSDHLAVVAKFHFQE